MSATGAALGEGARGGAADAGRGPGDDDDLACEAGAHPSGTTRGAAGVAQRHGADRRRVPPPAPVGVGRPPRSTATRATASTGSWARSTRSATARVHPGPPRGDRGVRGLRAREVHRRGRRLPGHLGPRARSTCSTASTTPSSTTSPWWRSSASRRGCRSAPTTSRRSTSTSLFKDVAAEFVQTLMVPEQAPHLVDRAMRDRAAPPARPPCIIVPNDVQELALRGAAARARRRASPRPSAIGTPRVAARRPDAPAAGRRGAQRRQRGSRCSSARAPRRRGREVAQVAELLGAGVAKALNGRAVLPGRPAVRDRLDRPARHQAVATT